MNGILAAMAERSPTMQKILRQFKADKDENHNRSVAELQRRHAAEAKAKTEKFDRLKQIFLQLTVQLKTDLPKIQLVTFLVRGRYVLPFRIDVDKRILYLSDSRTALARLKISSTSLMTGKVSYSNKTEKLVIEDMFGLVVVGEKGETELLSILSEKITHALTS